MYANCLYYAFLQRGVLVCTKPARRRLASILLIFPPAVFPLADPGAKRNRNKATTWRVRMRVHGGVWRYQQSDYMLLVMPSRTDHYTSDGHAGHVLRPPVLDCLATLFCYRSAGGQHARTQQRPLTARIASGLG